MRNIIIAASIMLTTSSAPASLHFNSSNSPARYEDDVPISDQLDLKSSSNPEQVEEASVRRYLPMILNIVENDTEHSEDQKTDQLSSVPINHVESALLYIYISVITVVFMLTLYWYKGRQKKGLEHGQINIVNMAMAIVDIPGPTPIAASRKYNISR